MTENETKVDFDPALVATGQIIDTQKDTESGRNFQHAPEVVSDSRNRALSVDINQKEIYNNNSTLDPRLWSLKKKLAIAVFIFLTAFTATIGTPVYMAAIPDVQYRFKLTTTYALLPASLYALALGLGAIVTSSFSEIYGRRIIYRLTLPAALLATVLASISSQFIYMVTFKTLAGILSAPNLTVGVGVLNDLWDPKQDRTGTIMAVLFVLCIIWATQFGPLISASVMEKWNHWQWTFHISSLLLIFCVLLAFLVPETYMPEIIRTDAKRQGKIVKSRRLTWHVVRNAASQPLHMILVEPIVFPTGLVLAITQSVIFSYYVAYASLFESVYGFTQLQVGFSFTPLVLGTLFALPILAACEKWIYQKARKDNLTDGKFIMPESRLYPAMFSSLTMPISLFWLAWTGREDIHWIIPVISGILFGFSYVLNMLCLPIYNNDIYTTQLGASVLAASTFMRFVISPGFMLLMPIILLHLGFAWSVSLLGFTTIALIPVPFIFFNYGPRLRAKSRYLSNRPS
ncbi:MFS transporter [Blumeria hordei DH14]|uniref:MFS transporter n=1 Tax=Blumeria graminis f. sp. hordei (strain DH14) TaxID=546991 RepID=N1JGV8_BLUG1|nr:MFS transporter [Blumeria hordei DH14]